MYYFLLIFSQCFPLLLALQLCMCWPVTWHLSMTNRWVSPFWQPASSSSVFTASLSCSSSGSSSHSSPLFRSFFFFLFSGFYMLFLKCVLVYILAMDCQQLLDTQLQLHLQFPAQKNIYILFFFLPLYKRRICGWEKELETGPRGSNDGHKSS